MQMVLIGKDHGYAYDRLKEETQKEGIELSVASIHSLIFSVQKNVFSLFDKNGKNLMGSDCYYFRGIGDADQEVMVMAKYLKKVAVVIEEIVSDGAFFMDKLFLGAVSNKVPTPNYFMIQSEKALNSVIRTLTYPTVIKSTIGSMGKSVQLAHDRSELQTAFKELGPRVILQEYLPVACDYRAMVIGGKYIGAYKRTRSDGEFRMNRPGNTKEQVNLPKDVITLCELSAQCQNIEIAGIDLIQYEGKWYVLEINTSPAFHQFEVVTGVNVGEKIINYVISKVKKAGKAD